MTTVATSPDGAGSAALRAPLPQADRAAPGDHGPVSTENDNGAERALLFTDAVCAIAITLLVLPLVDVAAGDGPGPGSAGTLIAEHRDEFVSFLVSFLVIARLWSVHHQVFRSVAAIDGLMVANFGWLLMIVALPFPTTLLSRFPDDRIVAPLYIATIAAASAFQTVITLIVRARPQLRHGDGPLDPGFVFNSVATSAVLLLALVLAVAVPPIHLQGLVLMLAVPLAARIRRARRPTTQRPSDG